MDQPEINPNFNQANINQDTIQAKIIGNQPEKLAGKQPENQPQPPAKLPQNKVLGIPVHVHDNYLAWLEQRFLKGVGTQVITLNTEMVMQARQNPELAKLIEQVDLAVPDGSGVVLYLRSRQIEVNRCPGIELAEALVQVGMGAGKKIFLIGGAPGVLETVQQVICEQWQNNLGENNLAQNNLKFNLGAIAGLQHGYFDATEEQDLLTRLQTIQPDLILVGLGVPRQEFWIQQQRSFCPNATWIGVGGSFDVWAGIKSRAPVWLRENNLEWFYRLYKEPWRWRRMLSIPQFAWYATVQSISDRFSGT